MATQVESLVNGIKVIQVIADDNDYASEDLKTERMNICTKCEFNQNNESCEKCFCLLAALVSRLDATCPEGRW